MYCICVPGPFNVCHFFPHVCHFFPHVHLFLGQPSPDLTVDSRYTDRDNSWVSGQRPEGSQPVDCNLGDEDRPKKATPGLPFVWVRPAASRMLDLKLRCPKFHTDSLCFYRKKRVGIIWEIYHKSNTSANSNCF